MVDTNRLRLIGFMLALTTALTTAVAAAGVFIDSLG